MNTFEKLNAKYACDSAKIGETSPNAAFTEYETSVNSWLLLIEKRPSSLRTNRMIRIITRYCTYEKLSHSLSVQEVGRLGGTSSVVIQCFSGTGDWLRRLLK